MSRTQNRGFVSAVGGEVEDVADTKPRFCVRRGDEGRGMLKTLRLQAIEVPEIR